MTIYSVASALHEKMRRCKENLKQEDGEIKIDDLIDVARDIAVLHNLEQISSQKNENDDKILTLEMPLHN